MPKVLAKDSCKGIPYLSGGVGIGEREELREMRKNYNLKLIFAREDGDYLADVNVVIGNEKGEKLLDVNSPGPWFYTKLPPGKYNVTATVEGSTVQKEIQVGSNGMTDVVLYWKK